MLPADLLILPFFSSVFLSLLFPSFFSSSSSLGDGAAPDFLSLSLSLLLWLHTLEVVNMESISACASIDSSSPRLRCRPLFFSASPIQRNSNQRCLGEHLHLMFSHPIKKCCEPQTSVGNPERKLSGFWRYHSSSWRGSSGGAASGGRGGVAFTGGGFCRGRVRTPPWDHHGDQNKHKKVAAGAWFPCQN